MQLKSDVRVKSDIVPFAKPVHTRFVCLSKIIIRAGPKTILEQIHPYLEELFLQKASIFRYRALPTTEVICKVQNKLPIQKRNLSSELVKI